MDQTPENISVYFGTYSIRRKANPFFHRASICFAPVAKAGIVEHTEMGIDCGETTSNWAKFFFRFSRMRARRNETEPYLHDRGDDPVDRHSFVIFPLRRTIHLWYVVSVKGHFLVLHLALFFPSFFQTVR